MTTYSCHMSLYVDSANPVARTELRAFWTNARILAWRSSNVMAATEMDLKIELDRMIYDAFKNQMAIDLGVPVARITGATAFAAAAWNIGRSGTHEGSSVIKVDLQNPADRRNWAMKGSNEVVRAHVDWIEI